MGWAEFWEATPFATRLYIEAWTANERTAQERAIFASFQVAYFSRFEKLGPRDLDKALGRKPKVSRQQSEREIMRNVFAWLKTAEAPHGVAEH